MNATATIEDKVSVVPQGAVVVLRAHAEPRELGIVLHGFVRKLGGSVTSPEFGTYVATVPGDGEGVMHAFLGQYSRNALVDVSVGIGRDAEEALESVSRVRITPGRYEVKNEYNNAA